MLPATPHRDPVHDHTTDSRDELSLDLCAYTDRFLQRHRLMVRVGRCRHNVALVFRRLQLTVAEGLLVKRLLARNIDAAAGVALDLTPFEPPAAPGRLQRLLASLRQGRIAPILPHLPRRLPLPRIPGSQTVSRILGELRIERIVGRRSSFRTSGVRRLFFVDAGELKVSALEGCPYTYHKYLEGLLDFDHLDALPNDVLVVLYGDLTGVPDRVLLHSQIVLLAAFMRPGDERSATSLVADTCWSSYFDASAASRELLSVAGDAFVRTVFDYVLREDLALVRATDRVLSYFGQRLELVLDNYDSRLFSLGQFILENMPRHSVVALQKVLGPYTLSFDLRGDSGVYRQPSRLIAWGAFHEERLRALGYTCPVENRRMFRLSAYDRLHDMSADDIKRRLGIPKDKRVVMFSAVQKVVGYPLIEPWQFVEMLQELADAAAAQNAFVIFKPWPGENEDEILRIARCVFRSDWLFFKSAMIGQFHNAELLRVTDVLISTLSSFIGEAIFFDAIPVLVTNPACEAYFSRRYADEFSRFCLVVDERNRLRNVISRALEMSELERAAFVEGGQAAATAVFGDVEPRRSPPPFAARRPVSVL